MRWDGERSGKFRFCSYLEPIFISMPGSHEAFHDASLLIHLHRENAPMARLIIVLRDRASKGFVQFLDLCIEDLREAQQVRE